MPGSSNISGLSSGIDWNTIVDQLMAVEQNKVTLLQVRQQNELARQDALNSISSSLSTLRTDAINMADASKFFSYTTTLASSSTTSADSLLSVQTSSSASAGTHTVIVQQLAQAQKTGSGAAVADSTGTAVSSETTVLGISGSFSVAGQTVNVAATDSLKNIRDNINQLNTGSSATGVTASILKVGTSDYRLILTADDTGATGFTLTGADLDTASPGGLSGLNLGSTANLRQTLQAAADAQVQIDGYTVTRSSNTIDDAITGLTLDLVKADAATTVTVKVATDTQAAKDQVQQFVDDYNTIIDFINSQVAFDTETQTAGILAGDSIVRSIQSALSSSVLQSVSGLSSDRNSLVLIGVAPDETGKLVVDDATLDNWLATDPTAVRDVFAATAVSDNPALSFITYGDNTISGNYAVNITQAATRASVTGTTDLSGGLGGNETVTITDGAGRQAVVGLTTSQSLSSIVSALNTEFAATYTEQRQMSTALVTGMGGPAATSSTTFSQLVDNTTGASLNVAAGDTVSISGTKRNGTAVSSTFTVLDPATDTLSDLLTAIQVAFDNQVAATVDASGNVTITDGSEGDSSLSFTLTANNEGGGTLGFGAESVVTEGRYTMDLAAAASGNFLQIQNNAYGSGSSFTISQTVNNLGIVDTTYSGVDVAGSIGGQAATGSGQVLTGDTDGLALMYTGSATGAIGNVTVSMGVGAQYDSLLYTFTDPVSGLLQNSIGASGDVYDNLQARIDDLNFQIEQERQRLIASFQQMETVMSQINATSQWLGQQIDGFNSSSN